MRKTILIGLVAIAMLFAFTACDNTPTWTNATVSDVSLASSPDYLTGEVIDPSQVMLSITSVDGKVTTRSAAGAIAVGTVADADTALSVKVGGETFSIYLPVYAADALVIDGSASTYTQTVGSQAQAALNGDNVLDGLKYTVEYAKGTKEVPASAVTGVSVATDTANVVGTAKVRLGQSAEVKVYGNKVSDVTIENWNVTITAATEAPATSFTAALTTKIDELIQVAEEEFRKDSQYENEINRLKDNINQLKEENENIKSSNSWKITKPLRNITNKFK